MAKPEPWRLLLASYPQTLDVPTRFQDMDVNGHLNNAVSYTHLTLPTKRIV